MRHDAATAPAGLGYNRPMGTRLRHLLLTTTEDPFDMKAWSGIPYSLREALQGRVDRLSVFRPAPPARSPLAVARRLLHGSSSHPLWISPAALRQNARQVAAEIRRIQPDAVLSISSQALVALDPLPVPTFLFSDAPYMTFTETYARWETAPARINAFALEEASLGRRLDGLCFGSTWACEEARTQYRLAATQADKLYVTPLGANFTPAGGSEEVASAIAHRQFSRLELLFVGRDWERKGGPLAVAVAKQIRASGTDVHLHIVGCRPELGEAAAPHGFVTLYGLLNRDDEAQRRKLESLYLQSHFLITPTLAECFGIVFAEAHAFGLPAVSRAVDAVPSIVEDGSTGLLFAPEAEAPLYAERLLQVFQHPDRYRAMASAARMRFEQKLTWDACAGGITSVLASFLETSS